MKSLCFLLLVALPVMAQTKAGKIYTWVDADGVTHYSDSPEGAPKGTRVSTTTGADLNTIVGEAPRGSEAEEAAEEARIDEVHAAREAAATEAEWKKRFREAREKVRKLENQVEVERAQLEEVNGMPMMRVGTCRNGLWVNQLGQVQAVPYCNPDYLAGRKAKLESLRGDLKVAKDELQQLERDASFAAVPQNWRR